MEDKLLAAYLNGTENRNWQHVTFQMSDSMEKAIYLAITVENAMKRGQK
jgi:hypothetical protein